MLFDPAFPRSVPAAQFSRLEARARAKPRVAFAGEFSAGKSTLLNLILGQRVLPAQATATALPPVLLSYGSGGDHYTDADGARHELAPDRLYEVPGDAALVRLFLQAPILERCDILDLAGISDPGRSDLPAHRLMRSAHMVVWCTTATQAWRQSEHSTWSAMPRRLYEHSLLAITRADLLGSDGDRQKVLRRAMREAGALFSGWTTISAPQARQAQISGDARLLEASGYPELMTLLDTGIAALAAARLALLERYVVPVSAGQIEAAEAEVSPASAPEAGIPDSGDTVSAVRPIRPQRPVSRPISARAGVRVVTRPLSAPEPGPETEPEAGPETEPEAGQHTAAELAADPAPASALAAPLLLTNPVLPEDDRPLAALLPAWDQLPETDAPGPEAEAEEDPVEAVDISRILARLNAGGPANGPQAGAGPGEPTAAGEPAQDTAAPRPGAMADGPVADEAVEAAASPALGQAAQIQAPESPATAQPALADGQAGERVQATRAAQDPATEPTPGQPPEAAQGLNSGPEPEAAPMAETVPEAAPESAPVPAAAPDGTAACARPSAGVVTLSPAGRKAPEPAHELPRELALWRRIVAETPGAAEHALVVGMIDRLLAGLAAPPEAAAQPSPQTAQVL